MNQSQLLDNLARAIDAPRKPDRLKEIREAFAEYTASLNKKPWWKIWSEVKLTRWLNG